MSISPYELEKMQARLAAGKKANAPSGVPCGCEICETGEPDISESQLHQEIAKDCRERGCLALHGSMAHKTHRTLGEPDFVILAPKGRLVMIECKTPGKKQTVEQLHFSDRAKALGHHVFVVQSIRAWKNILKVIETGTVLSA